MRPAPTAAGRPGKTHKVAEWLRYWFTGWVGDGPADLSRLDILDSIHTKEQK
jgi:hypothetical protein